MNCQQSAFDSGINVAISWLWCFLVCNHFIFKGYEDVFHWVNISLWVPLFKHLVFIEIDLPVLLVNRGDVDLWYELHRWGCSWVLVTTNEWQKVDTIVKVSVSRSDDSSIPVCEGLVIAFIESIGNALIGQSSFFCLFQFVVKLEGSWFYENKGLDNLVCDKLASCDEDSIVLSWVQIQIEGQLDRVNERSSVSFSWQGASSWYESKNELELTRFHDCFFL